MRTTLLSICLCWFALSATALLSQTGTGSALPTDPQELYALMYNSNGLTAADLLPWHIKVAYALFAMECAHVRYCERGAPNWLQG